VFYQEQSVDCLKCGHASTYRSERHSWHCNQKIRVLKRGKKSRACGYMVSDYRGIFIRKGKCWPHGGLWGEAPQLGIWPGRLGQVTLGLLM